jgi:hypothetical protein
MAGDGLRGTRLTVLLLTFVVASPVAAVALWSIGKTVRELANPCITWGYPQGQPMSMHVGPNDPCREPGMNSLTRTQAVLLAAMAPGGLLAAALLGVAGAASSRRRMMLAGALVMLLETLVAFSIWPLTLIAGLSIIFLAQRVPTSVDVPSIESSPR